MIPAVLRRLVSDGTKTCTWNKQAALGALYKLLRDPEKINNNVIREFHEVFGNVICPSQVQGLSHIRDNRLNKGLAFPLEERQKLGIQGLLPPTFRTQEQQLELCKLSVSKIKEDLNKYLYLTELHDCNEKLFFRLLTENVEQMMPIVYTPTVGLACQKFGLIYRRPRGLFITINDRGHIYDVLRNWPEHDVKYIVVTDGERILGLGDLGACGMGIPVGKLSLYTALAGIKPHQCLPITLDVGTNNTTLLEDPLYIGLRQNRIKDQRYDEFVDEFMEAVVKRYGQHCLIQFEDFGNQNAFHFLKKYRNLYCTFNDDIQGTAAVILAGLFVSSRITGLKKLSDNNILFLGAGEAALGTASLVSSAMELEGLSKKEAESKIWMMDIKGLITDNRPLDQLAGDKKKFAKKHECTKSLLDIVKEVKPSMLIGASAAPGTFTPDVLKAMAANHQRPVIFALSNPTSKAECTAKEAYEYTDGRCIFCSGSPFGTVEYKGKKFKPGQGNNAYAFPGIALGIVASGIYHITDEIFLITAQELAKMVTPEDLEIGSVFPPLSKIREASIKIALRITYNAYSKDMATVYPEPQDKLQYIVSQLYNFNYESALPNTWTWSRLPEMKTKPIGSIN